jgi:hypothetical protein
MDQIPTPRTDAQVFREPGGRYVVKSDCATQLERELAVALDALRSCSQGTYGAGLNYGEPHIEAETAREALEEVEAMRRAAAEGRSEGHEDGK